MTEVSGPKGRWGVGVGWEILRGPEGGAVCGEMVGSLAKRSFGCLFKLRRGEEFSGGM